MKRIVTPDKNHDRCNRSSGSLRSQCQWVHIILITLSALVHIISSNDEIVSHIRKCCISGIQYAVKQTNCEKYDYQVTTIPPLWRGLCHSTYGVCCSRKLEEQYCVAGRLAALRGSPCDEQYNTTAFTDCCRGCQVGLAVKASNNDCKNAFFSYFHKMETYHICCDGRRDNYDFFGGIIVDNNDADHVGKERKANNYLNASEEELEPNMSDELIDNASDGTIVLPVDDDDICGKVPNLCAHICENTKEAYRCKCNPGHKLDDNNVTCSRINNDINECSINNHNCLPTQRCDNTHGSYVCVRLQSCGTGYTLNAETGNCDDDDECALDTHNCPPDYECHNTKGSFRCYRRMPSTMRTTTTKSSTITATTPASVSSPYYYRNRTTYNYPNNYASHQTLSHNRDPVNNPLPSCDIGFHRNQLGACVDLNECILTNPCRSHQRCVNTNGSYRCQNLLQCSAGYKSTPDGTQCVDIDECESGEHHCAENQICRNRNGGYICSCPLGHQLSRMRNDLSLCVDINECDQAHPTVCPSNAHCLNTIGSYYCECKSGFQKSKDNEHICLDVDECQEIQGLCQQKCVNYWGGYRCTCNQGFELGADNRTCNDVDECEVHKTYTLCMGYCNNVPGSYECSCPRGYLLSVDKTTCRDIDECATGEFCTGRNDICTNIHGSFKCTTIHCQYGYVNDPDQRNRCRLTNNLCEGDECYSKPSAYTYNFITLISKLSIPPEGRIIFSLRGPLWYDAIDFDLKIIKIQAAANIEKALGNHFDTIKGKHEVHLQLKRSLQGPQEIELELSMTVFTNGMPRGKSVAKIFILVSQHTF
ncbi:fibulin-1 isoform X4 [Anastrepha obliqua]|uniref:fibulin-1 isoform X4 n=1 Tax=Anastrepha obliqua TaxID=95512 RepID=UPI00240A118B|nr:fibulin-1 isoform X4 [Anastrepha obliqua]